MKAAPQPTPDKKLGQDLKLFKELPAKTQELLALTDESAKTTGKASAPSQSASATELSEAFPTLTAGRVPMLSRSLRRS